VPSLPLTHNAELSYTPGHRKGVLITSPQVTDVHILVPSGVIAGELKEEISRLNALGERGANGLREIYDRDALKEVRPVVERGD